jgi:HAD superfamily hydrolase (TIGR01509 family)
LNKLDALKRLLDGSAAVIFDFDNVIVDSEPYHYEAYARVFAKRGHVIDRDEYWLEWTSRGGGAESEIRRYGLDLDPAAIRAEKDPIYAGFCRSGAIRPFPEASAVIERLSRRGLALAIASGSYEADIRAILDTCGLDRSFGAVVGKDGIARWKPHPDTYLAAAAALGVEPGRCLAVEDAEKGIRSARAAGDRSA